MTRRWTIESALMGMLGLLALAYPVMAGIAGRGHEAAFLPFMADVVEGVQGGSLLLLLGLGVLGGVFGKAPPFLLGFASVATLPLWSTIDLAMGGGGHNVLPFEWLIYGFYGLVSTAGVIIGRNRGLRKRSQAGTGAG